MWAALRHRTLYPSSSSSAVQQWKLGFSVLNRALYSTLADSSNSSTDTKQGLLQLEEVEKILSDVKADNVKVIPMQNRCEFADYMVIATGRSAWHVRNIAQALIYKAGWLMGFCLLHSGEQVKQKQQGAKRMLLPSVEGQEGGNWIVIDSEFCPFDALSDNLTAQPGKLEAAIQMFFYLCDHERAGPSYVTIRGSGSLNAFLPAGKFNWFIVIQICPLIIHALDEKVRAYYNLEKLWNTETSNNEGSRDLEKAFVKVRRKNNSKKPAKKSA
ncbi:hypothetical protein RJ640_030782 [Escallonia rubra]|uniref:Uncharacterized protein n=1 Tax=Escallonia rubra TaxID=112253 RepID=A0AA88QC38_9ASTE|nr:hypothetical protein RJ640_030782 [Escallonia rubra]